MTAAADLLEHPIPYGYCHCRCGGRTLTAKKTSSLDGHIKGQPVRFISGHNTRVRLLQGIAERFWEKVDRTSTPAGCWPWLACRDRHGYGRICINGRVRPAHQIALELAGWIIPCEWLQARHFVCDNPPCCRPDHLKIGTPQDDTDDKVSQGRQARGEHHGSAKLNQGLVQEILALYQRGVRGRGCEALAKRFGVTPENIWRILHGETWKHIDRQHHDPKGENEHDDREENPHPGLHYLGRVGIHGHEKSRHLRGLQPVPPRPEGPDCR